MNDLLERLRRDDPSALEEVGHQLLPFVQSALLAQALRSRDQDLVLEAFKAAVAHARRLATGDDFARLVVQHVRDHAASLPVAPEEPALADALQTLARLQPLPVADRELTVARFVERLTAPLICAQFGLEPAALSEALGRGALALLGPTASGAPWTAEASLLDPSAPPAAGLVELENLLSALAVDVTALEQQPLLAPLPVLKPGFTPQAPAEHYPSHVATQAAIDLPVQMSASPPPRAVDVVAFSPRPEPAPGAARRSAREEPDGEATAPMGQRLVEVTQSPPEITPRLAQPVPEVTPILAAPAERPRPETPAVPISILASSWQPTPKGSTGATVQDLPPVDDGHTRLAYAPQLPQRWALRPATLWATTGGLAVVAAALYFAAFEHLDAVTRRSWNLVEVMVAARDLDKGQTLTADMVAPRLVPAPLATTSVVQRDQLSLTMGKPLTADLEAGDSLRWTAFDVDARRRRLTVLHRSRAYAIPVSVIEGVGELARPGDHADLILKMRQVADAGPQTITILQDAVVLAVGPFIEETIGRLQLRYANVSLQLLPEEAEALGEALQVGELTMTLRGLEGAGDEPLQPRNTTLQTLNDPEGLRELQHRKDVLLPRNIEATWPAGAEPRP